MRHVLIVGSLLFVAVAAGCAGNRPALRTESSTAAIRAAQEVGAGGVPQAALHLRMANEELDRAKGLSDGGKKDEAESQLLRAEADANLAILLSKEQAGKLEAAQSMERVHQLQKDNR